MMRVRFLSPAWREYADALLWYQRERPGLGGDLADEIQAAVDRVCRDPQSWEQVDSNCRRVPLKRFPYSVIFRVDDAKREIVIVAIAHNSRRPGYWKRRAQKS